MKKIVLISRKFNDFVIPQREIDGYINATAMCAAFGKEVYDWIRTESTFNLVSALAKKLGIQPSVNIEESETGENRKQGWERKTSKISECFPNLVMMKKGGFDKGGGTWIHYKLGVPLAQWLSPEQTGIYEGIDLGPKPISISSKGICPLCKKPI